MIWGNCSSELVRTLFAMAPARPLLPSSLNGRGTLRLYTALAQIRSHLACEGNPILADRLGSIFLARVIQTNAVTRGTRNPNQCRDTWQ